MKLAVFAAAPLALALVACDTNESPEEMQEEQLENQADELDAMAEEQPTEMQEDQMEDRADELDDQADEM